MKSAQLRHYLKKSLPFPIIWSVGALLYVVVEKGILGDAATYPSTGNAYDFHSGLYFRVPAALLTGFVMGLLEVSVLRNFLQHKTFFYKVSVKTLLFTLVISCFLVISSLSSSAGERQLSMLHPDVVEDTLGFLNNYAFFSIMVFAGVFNFIAYYISETIDSLGLTVISNFFSGRYKRPRTESRIFMFLDMRSSTTLAEQLGNIQYYHLLKDYYQGMSRSIIAAEGEVYQYVGDEIVISWPLRKGLRNENCLRCFFDIRSNMYSKEEFYLKRYGVRPGFKAGIHIGEITAGEIGEIKKEVLYTGDVLNTTSRIQSLCNELGKDLLISRELYHCFKSSARYRFDRVGSFELKGKNEKAELFAVSLSSDKSES